MPRRIVQRAVRRGVRRRVYRHSGRPRRAVGIFILFRLLRRLFR